MLHIEFVDLLSGSHIQLYLITWLSTIAIFLVLCSLKMVGIEAVIQN